MHLLQCRYHENINFTFVKSMIKYPCYAWHLFQWTLVMRYLYSYIVFHFIDRQIECIICNVLRRTSFFVPLSLCLCHCQWENGDVRTKLIRKWKQRYNVCNVRIPECYCYWCTTLHLYLTLWLWTRYWAVVIL